jgi:hypothetical protein
MDPIKLILLKECLMDLQDEEHLETQVVVVMITMHGGGGNGGLEIRGRGWQGAGGDVNP